MSNDYKEQEFLDKVATRIAEIRRANGVTQEQLAAETGLDRVAIANIEIGRRRPTVTTIYRLAKGLKVDVTQFFTESRR